MVVKGPRLTAVPLYWSFLTCLLLCSAVRHHTESKRFSTANSGATSVSLSQNAEQKNKDADQRTHARATKKFVFIRHGESAGNVNPDAGNADGLLTDAGESQAVTRVALMDVELLQKVSQSELVLVSPLRRAMATSLIVAAEVMKRCQSEAASLTFFMKPSLCGDFESLHPKVVVDIHLRASAPEPGWYQKIPGWYEKSPFDDPGCGREDSFAVAKLRSFATDPLLYLEKIFEKYQKGLSTSSLARFRVITDRMTTSYKLARFAATGETSYHWWTTGTTEDWLHNCKVWNMPNSGRLPKDADAFADEIRVFKNEVLDYTDDNLLIVGHSGWVRFSFAAWCPWAVAPKTAEEKLKKALENLRVGGIEGIRTLNNAGVVTGEIAHKVEARSDNFQVVRNFPVYRRAYQQNASANPKFPAGAFQNVHIGPITPGSEAFPNTKDSPKVGFFSRMDEAKDAGMIPVASCFMNAYFEKQLWTGWEARTFVLSWYSGTAVLSWASKWAEPRGQITLSGVEFVREKPYIVSATTNDCPLSVCKRINMRIPEDFGMPLAEQFAAMVAWEALLQGYMNIEDPSVCP